jgi:hypothetical protein
VTDVRPDALTVNVAAPVLVLSAVTVTVCAVPKFDGVNVSELPAVTESPVFPDVRATVTVTFADGAADSEIPTVPVLPWLMFCEAGVTTRPGVPPDDVVSFTVNVTDVYPEALTVNVAVPVLEEFAAIVTSCTVEKFDGVKVSDPPDETDSPLFPEVAAVVTVTLADGAADRDIATVPERLWVMFCDVGFTTMLPVEPVTWPVHVTPLRVNTVGLVLVPL